MANSTTNIDTISTSQANKEATANAFFDAASQASTYGRRASTSSGLTWGYYGGNVVRTSDGATVQIANGTLTLTASQTNYIVAEKATGAVSFSTATTNWDNAADYWRLYSVVAGASTVTSWTDVRAPAQYQGGGSGGGGGIPPGGDADDMLVKQSSTDGDAAWETPEQVRTNLSVRERLTANRTYYVRTDGSDSNDGLSDTSGGAFLTIQKAIDVAAGLDTGIYNITISVGAGTFSEAVVLKDPQGAGAITVSGAGSSLTIISPPSGNAVTANRSEKCVLQNLALSATGSTSATCLVASRNSYVGISTDVSFNAAGSNGSHIHVLTGSKVEITSAYTIAGNTNRHFRLQSGSKIICINRTVTLTGTPAFSAFCFAEGSSYIHVSGNTYSGSATGQRYNVSKGAVIDTAGGGATYLPGDSSGTADNATGGYYV